MTFSLKKEDGGIENAAFVPTDEVRNMQIMHSFLFTQLVKMYISKILVPGTRLAIEKYLIFLAKL